MKQKRIKTISCKEATKFICENLNEESNSALCIQIKKHIKSCPDCRYQLASLKKIVTLYKTYPETGLSESMHKTLITRLTSVRH